MNGDNAGAGQLRTPEQDLKIQVSNNLDKVFETHAQLHRFTGQMREKLDKHHGRHPFWLEKKWTRQELKMEMLRCILEEDPVSLSNYGMMYYVLFTSRDPQPEATQPSY